MKCAVCDSGPAEGVTVYRMNEKGQPGLWSCNEHKDHFDAIVPEDVMCIVDVLAARRPRQ